MTTSLVFIFNRLPSPSGRPRFRRSGRFPLVAIPTSLPISALLRTTSLLCRRCNGNAHAKPTRRNPLSFQHWAGSLLLRVDDVENTSDSHLKGASIWRPLPISWRGIFAIAVWTSSPGSRVASPAASANRSGSWRSTSLQPLPSLQQVIRRLGGA